jgi:hypothetical protein
MMALLVVPLCKTSPARRHGARPTLRTPRLHGWTPAVKGLAGPVLPPRAQHSPDAESVLSFTGTPAQILQSMPRYQGVGVQDFRVDFPSPSVDRLLQAVERFATGVRPQVQA